MPWFAERVTKLMDFGAFVEFEPGIEGLVHISELSHKRVWRASDVVKEGEQVEVFVLSVDAEAQRISLSMKALAAPPEPAKKQESAGEAAPAKASKKSIEADRPAAGRAEPLDRRPLRVEVVGCGAACGAGVSPARPKASGMPIGSGGS